MFALFKDLSKKENKLLILVFLLVLVRFSFLFVFSHNCYLCTATHSQGEVAANLLDGKWIYVGGYSEALQMQIESGKLVDIEHVKADENPSLEPFVGNMPGYGVVLSFFWWIFGTKNYIFVQIFQIILDFFALLAFYYMSKRIFGESVAFMSGLVYVFFFPLAFLTVVAFRDIFPFFAGIFISYLLFRVIEDEKLNRTKYYVLAGFLAGFFTWLRETNAAIPLFFGCVLLFKYGKKEWLKATFIMTSAMLIIISPWVVRNYVVFGLFVPLSTEMGAGWITGFGEYENPWGMEYDDGFAYQYVLNKGYDVAYLSPEHDQAAKKLAMSMVLEEPLLYIKQVSMRFLRGVFLQPNPKSTSFLSTSKFSGLIKSAFFVFSLSSILSAAYILRERKKDFAYIALLITPALYFPLIYAPFNMGLRHALAGIWAYYLLFSYGLAGVFKWIKKKKSRSGVVLL